MTAYVTDRSADGWVAVTDEYKPGHPIGFGHTENEAIVDLKALLREPPSITQIARQEDVRAWREDFCRRYRKRHIAFAVIVYAIEGIVCLVIGAFLVMLFLGTV